MDKKNSRKISLYLLYTLIIINISSCSLIDNLIEKEPAEVNTIFVGTQYNGNEYFISDDEIMGGTDIFMLENNVKTIIESDKISSTPSSIIRYNNDIYISGDYIDEDNRSYACYWKNGHRIELNGSKATATDIYIDNSDIYVTGYYYDGDYIPCYWKNGTLNILPTNETHGYAYGIVEHQNKIIIIGSSENTACYWIDGELNLLEIGSYYTYSYATGITISNNDIYISGNLRTNNYTKQTACYWKNGELNILSSSTTDGGTSNIYSENGNVYITGQSYHWSPLTQYGCYWKNGTRVDVTDSELVYDLYINNNSVHYLSVPTEYWLNRFTYNIDSEVQNLNLNKDEKVSSFLFY